MSIFLIGTMLKWCNYSFCFQTEKDNYNPKHYLILQQHLSCNVIKFQLHISSIRQLVQNFTEVPIFFINLTIEMIGH